MPTLVVSLQQLRLTPSTTSPFDCLASGISLEPDISPFVSGAGTCLHSHTSWSPTQQFYLPPTEKSCAQLLRKSSKSPLFWQFNCQASFQQLYKNKVFQTAEVMWACLWTTWSSWRCPWSLQGGWTRWSSHLRSLPTCTAWWFYDSKWLSCSQYPQHLKHHKGSGYFLPPPPSSPMLLLSQARERCSSPAINTT